MAHRFPSAIDRGRYAESAALASSALLGAVALWLLVRLVWLLVPRGDVGLDAAPARIAPGVTGAVPAQSVAKWHLFGTSARAAGEGGSIASTLALSLRGTVADSDPKAGIAVVGDAQNGERAFRVGEEVSPGVRLGAVYADRVTLLRDGAEETLKLPRDQRLRPGDVVRPGTGALASGAAVTAAPSAGAGAAAGPFPPTAPQVAATAPADWQQTAAQLRQNPAEFARRVQITPVLDGGKLAGVRLSSTTDAALITQLGLRSGDVITSVNGMAVDSFARGEQIMASLGNSTSVRATVLRDGKPIDLTIGLQ